MRSHLARFRADPWWLVHGHHGQSQQRLRNVIRQASLQIHQELHSAKTGGIPQSKLVLLPCALLFNEASLLSLLGCMFLLCFHFRFRHHLAFTISGNSPAHCVHPWCTRLAGHTVGKQQDGRDLDDLDGLKAKGK